MFPISLGWYFGIFAVITLLAVAVMSPDSEDDYGMTNGQALIGTVWLIWIVIGVASVFRYAIERDDAKETAKPQSQAITTPQISIVAQPNGSTTQVIKQGDKLITITITIKEDKQ